jgi:stage V sporulation protein SpoVS
MKTTPKTTYIKVRADMGCVGIAGVVMQHLRAHDFAPIELRGVGPGAVNQAVKGIAIALDRLRKEDNVVLTCTPRIEDGVPRPGSESEEVSRVCLLVEVR